MLPFAWQQRSRPPGGLSFSAHLLSNEERPSLFHSRCRSVRRGLHLLTFFFERLHDPLASFEFVAKNRYFIRSSHRGFGAKWILCDQGLRGLPCLGYDEYSRKRRPKSRERLRVLGIDKACVHDTRPSNRRLRRQQIRSASSACSDHRSMTWTPLRKSPVLRHT